METTVTSAEARLARMHAMGWHEREERPPRPGVYLAAYRATPTRDPRIDVALWSRETGWGSHYITHWMALPENPNVHAPPSAS